MIIVKLRCGLGNQLFQYALGRQLAINNKTTLKIDKNSGLDIKGVYAPRKCELGHFNIVEDSANFWETFLAKKVEEKHYHFDEAILNTNDNSYLTGSWQSEKYFLNIRKTLLKELQPKNKIRVAININNSVAIHVRRADYVTNPYSHKKHGVCDMDYYLSAMKIISKKINNPRFYVFSDDEKWSIDNFEGIKNTIVVKRSNDDFIDFWKMRSCQHFIIANSSFSWWAAWLSDFQKKTVIAPRVWMLDKSYDTKDVVPKTWIKI